MNVLHSLEGMGTKGVAIAVSAYILCMSITGFSSMGIDKGRARRHAWRIPEATLFAIAIFGGSLGSTIGMHVFRHKTQHWYFKYGMPAILLIHILLLVWLFCFSPVVVI